MHEERLKNDDMCRVCRKSENRTYRFMQDVLGLFIYCAQTVIVCDQVCESRLGNIPNHDVITHGKRASEENKLLLDEASDVFRGYFTNKKLVVPADEEAELMWQKHKTMVAFSGTCLLEKDVPEGPITFENNAIFGHFRKICF
ncbi:hypothetical protein QVD17_11640 [Tagetes erecta]|uniref:Uncharacterized protein n=1 Tax=Tagetes erecta TaxID=13708 RepID=A0AAD8KYC5_TARER|nr:hypothetical protein QVD17_11640 [Tagetes erecta]